MTTDLQRFIESADGQHQLSSYVHDMEEDVVCLRLLCGFFSFLEGFEGFFRLSASHQVKGFLKIISCFFSQLLWALGHAQKMGLYCFIACVFLCLSSPFIQLPLLRDGCRGSCEFQFFAFAAGIIQVFNLYQLKLEVAGSGEIPHLLLFQPNTQSLAAGCSRAILIAICSGWVNRCIGWVFHARRRRAA